MREREHMAGALTNVKSDFPKIDATSIRSHATFASGRDPTLAYTGSHTHERSPFA